MTKKPRQGCVHIYTGDGKGKTTAALGLAVRAAGAGWRVYIQQFIKGMPYSELKALKKIKNIKIDQCGRRCFIKGRPTREDFGLAKKGFAKVRRCVLSGRYDLVILDEVNVALKFKLIKLNDVIDMIDHKPDSVELVLTGRYCPPALMRMADIVTEMREIKHPFARGIAARRGIEY